ncbi:MAG: hypothetical protein ABSF67_24175 [Roseiarcus sp.]|jgi:hypothetical protein
MFARALVSVIALMAAAVPALADAIGNFYVAAESDILQQRSVLAASVSNAEGWILLIRCEDGQQNVFLFVRDSHLSKGDSVSLNLRIDEGESQRIDSIVHTTNGSWPRSESAARTWSPSYPAPVASPSRGSVAG